MSDSEDNKQDSTDESEDELEDPKLMLLVEAGRVPGLDDNLQHLQRHNRKRKNKKKNKRTPSEGDTRPSKKTKCESVVEDEYVISKIISHLNKPSKHEAYQNCLMISEWFVKVPDDFEEKWITIPCPAGKRVLVVAASGTTRCFAKSGEFLFFFQSALPGGHVVGKDESSKSLTILDCLWHHTNRTYYVLDVLSWNTSHMLYCEARFRFFWLQQKLSELGSRLYANWTTNHYRFSFLPRVQCKKDNLMNAITNSSFQDEFKENVDGCLFYNVNAPYISGVSSAVGWLKPFMVPDVFQIPASSELLADLPDNYVSVEQFISEFEENKKKVIRKERKKRAQRIIRNYSQHARNVTKDDVKIEVEENIFKLRNFKEEMKYKERMECKNYKRSHKKLHK